MAASFIFPSQASENSQNVCQSPAKPPYPRRKFYTRSIAWIRHQPPMQTFLLQKSYITAVFGANNMHKTLCENEGLMLEE